MKIRAKGTFPSLFQQPPTAVSFEKTALLKVGSMAPACLAAACVVLGGALTQAQPVILNVTPDGSVQFQGQAPGTNTLSFEITSASGVTNVTVQLTATSLAGAASASTLTAGFGLLVLGDPTDENVSALLANDTEYTAVIAAADATGAATVSESFDTINPAYYTFEVEDWDYSTTNDTTVLYGQFFDNPQVDYYWLFGAAAGIDYLKKPLGSACAEAAYRPQGLATTGTGDKPRAQYISQGYTDYEVGCNSPGDWGNYTRTYPAGVYNIYCRISGGGPTANSASLGLVTGGQGTTKQTTGTMGTFATAGLAWETYTFEPLLDGSGNLVAWAAAGDVETLRFTQVNADDNVNFFLLVPAAPGISANDIFQGTPVTLTMDGKALHPLYYQWQTDNGTGGATWSNLGGATRPAYAPPTTNAGNFEYRVVLTNASLNVTSAVATLTVSPPTKPLVLRNIMPTSFTGVVGSVATFTASFFGSLPMTYQWEASTNGGITFDKIPQQTNTTLWVTNLVLVTNVEYELVAGNQFGSTNTSPATLTVVPAGPPGPPLELAGELIVNLQSVDLSSTARVWTNQTGYAASVGNFTDLAGTALNVTGATPLWNNLPVNALFVNYNLANAVQSARLAPNEIIGNNPCSAEAWVYLSAVEGANPNGTVIAYGMQGGTAAPMEDREFNFNTGGNGAVSGDFGTLDTGWTTPPTAGVWHYLAYTYDGTNFIGYLDGVANVTHQPGAPIDTAQTVVGVGAAVAGSNPGNIGTDAGIQGYIAAARLESGVLTASQITNNYAAGLLGVVPAAAALLPIRLGFSFKDGSLTLTWPSGGVLLQATTVLGPWTTNNTASSPCVINPAPGRPAMFFRIKSSQ